MKFSQASPGRIFVIRLENGEIIHEKLEQFAKEQNIKCASLIVLGGADKNSNLVVGPKNGNGSPITKMNTTLEDVHEVVGTGTIFPDETATPLLHLHISCGRNEKSITGCGRDGVIVWHVLEVILTELIDCSARRQLDEKTGFKLLEP